MISRYEPYEINDIRSQIDSGKDIEFSHGYMQFKTSHDNVVSGYRSLICEYYHILTKYIKQYSMTDKEMQMYSRRPKLMSNTLYGTPELWSGLLYINNMVSVVQFTQRTINIFTPGIIEVLEELMTIRHQDLSKNRLEVYGEL